MKIILISLLMLLMSCGGRMEGVALGTLERDRIAHTATANEVVTSLPIKAGSMVKKGDILVKLDDELQQAVVAKAQADVAQAIAELDKLRNGARAEEVAAASAKVEGAKAAVVESEANYYRVQKLSADDLASEADLNKAVATKDRDVANLKAVEEELLKLTNGNRVEDLRMGEAKLLSAEALLALEHKNLSNLTIKATRDGLLDNLPWNLGERVTQGSPLAIISAGKAPFARVYIPETVRVNVHVGDRLAVYVDGLDRTITGEVRWISTEPAFSPYYALNQEERTRLMYLAEVQLPSSESKLPSGLPAQVQLP